MRVILSGYKIELLSREYTSKNVKKLFFKYTYLGKNIVFISFNFCSDSIVEMADARILSRQGTVDGNCEMPRGHKYTCN